MKHVSNKMHGPKHTFIKDMSMQRPPLGANVWPSIDVAPPYGTIGTCTK